MGRFTFWHPQPSLGENKSEEKRTKAEGTEKGGRRGGGGDAGGRRPFRVRLALSAVQPAGCQGEESGLRGWFRARTPTTTTEIDLLSKSVNETSKTNKHAHWRPPPLTRSSVPQKPRGRKKKKPQHLRRPT